MTVLSLTQKRRKYDIFFRMVLVVYLGHGIFYTVS